MNQKINSNKTDETCDWSFPEINYLLNSSIEPIDNEKKINKKIEDEISKHKLEHNQMMIALKESKEEYESKISILNCIIKETENPLQNLTEDLMGLIVNVVQSAIKKIIFKEIEADRSVITNMIEELKLLISPQESLIIVYLSEADYNAIDLKEASPALSFRINKELTCGDLIIKSNTAEVRAILNDRLDKMMGAKS